MSFANLGNAILMYTVVYLSFDVNMFIERASKPAFRNYIPEQTEVVLNEPAVILDIHGRILLWNLPHIFSKSRVVCLPPIHCFLMLIRLIDLNQSSRHSACRSSSKKFKRWIQEKDLA